MLLTIPPGCTDFTHCHWCEYYNKWWWWMRH